MTRCTHDKASNPPEVITFGNEGQSKAPTRGLELYRFAGANATRLRIRVASLDSKSVLESHPPWRWLWQLASSRWLQWPTTTRFGRENANLDCLQSCKV